MESGSDFFFSKWATNYTKLENVVADKFSKSRNLSHMLNWNVIYSKRENKNKVVKRHHIIHGILQGWYHKT